MVISVEVIFEVQVLGGRQWKAFLAPALAGLGVWQHQQITALSWKPKRRHHRVTCNTTSKPISSVLPYECWQQNMPNRAAVVLWNMSELIPREVLSCTARCKVPARKLTSSGRKRFEKETYSTARQHSTKPDVTSCNDLTGHWGRTNHGQKYTQVWLWHLCWQPNIHSFTDIYFMASNRRFVST